MKEIKSMYAELEDMKKISAEKGQAMTIDERIQNLRELCSVYITEWKSYNPEDKPQEHLNAIKAEIDRLNQENFDLRTNSLKQMIS